MAEREKMKFSALEESKKDSSEFRHIVRVGNTDLKGEKVLYLSLQKIKGVGENFARAICVAAKINYMAKTGELNDKQVTALEQVIDAPAKAGIPTHYFNVQQDYETGETKHLFLSDLDFHKDQDIKRLRKIKSRRGLRHQWRLPLRGQRTQSNFRPNKGKATAVKKRAVTRK
ncbi:30S ribosomal protein S13 [Candidatus Woesearchaeota archaeon]|nr:30S ribosomal protein S13 [Candidatus Woesearchaeota archaeon]